MKKIKVILIDDHQLLLEGIASMLNNIEYITIAGKGSSGEEAINLANDLIPDIMLMDIMMAGMTGIEASRWIKEQNDKIKIILISSDVSEKFVSLAIKAGVDGYLPKNVSKENLIEAIQRVNKGERFFTKEVTDIVMNSIYIAESGGIKKNNYDGELSKRELEVLQQVTTGKSNQEVADELFISIKTVETHKTNIMSKLGLKNTVELVKYAIKNNIAEL